MHKRFISALLCLLLMPFSFPAMAELEVGRHVQLVVNEILLPLDEETGYICRDGADVYIPIAAVAEALGYDIAFNAKGTGIAITTQDGRIIKAVKGYRTITVSDEKASLEQPVEQIDGILLAHCSILSFLDAEMSTYPHNDQLMQLGYIGPAMVINRTGCSTLPPKIDRISFAADLEAAKTADQIIAVQYSGNGSAVLTYHEKINGAWMQLFDCEAYVGKNGIGKSVEGDRKTPRGTYELTFAFGIKADPGTQLPYTQLNKDHYWCCNEQSSYYNRLIDAAAENYEPAEGDLQLAVAKGYCEYAIALNYNPDCVPGKGSAVFLHCAGSDQPTNGSIAVSEEAMVLLLQVLKPGAKIVIF